MYVNDEAHRFSLVSHLSPYFILSNLIPSHPVILSRSVSLSSINIFSPLPVLSIGQAALRSRDNDAEGDPACSAAAVEQAGDVTIDTVVKAVGQEVGVIEGIGRCCCGGRRASSCGGCRLAGGSRQVWICQAACHGFCRNQNPFMLWS